MVNNLIDIELVGIKQLKEQYTPARFLDIILQNITYPETEEIVEKLTKKCSHIEFTLSNLNTNISRC